MIYVLRYSIDILFFSYILLIIFRESVRQFLSDVFLLQRLFSTYLFAASRRIFT